MESIDPVLETGAEGSSSVVFEERNFCAVQLPQRQHWSHPCTRAQARYGPVRRELSASSQQSFGGLIAALGREEGTEARKRGKSLAPTNFPPIFRTGLGGVRQRCRSSTTRSGSRSFRMQGAPGSLIFPISTFRRSPPLKSKISRCARDALR